MHTAHFYVSLSRMESNGLPVRIHLSQNTANEIILRGKKHWLTPREEKIVAKGKGEMQTYLVEVPSNRVSSSDDADSMAPSHASLGSNLEFDFDI